MSRPMTFQRYGRSCHLQIRSSADLQHVLARDAALWVATGTPTDAIHADPVFESYIDTDNNKRVMCFEIKDAIAWMLKHLSDTRGVDASSPVLDLDHIDVSHESGKRLLTEARKILSQVGSADTGRLALEQVRKIKAKIESTPVSESGVVLPEATNEPSLQAFINDIIKTVGGVPHPAKKDGITQEKLEAFLEQAKAHLDWRSQGAVPDGKAKTEIMPLGQRTPRAYDVYARLRDKIDQFFAQCHAITFEPRAAAHVRASEERLKAADLNDPKAVEALLRDSPLADPRTDGSLFLAERFNPLFADAVQDLRARVLPLILGREAKILTERDWRRVKDTFAAHQAWRDAQAGGAWFHTIGGVLESAGGNRRFHRA